MKNLKYYLVFILILIISFLDGYGFYVLINEDLFKNKNQPIKQTKPIVQNIYYI